jgi:hypothetical protein
MAEVIRARLSEDVSRAELSRIWESERAETTVPEIVFESAGREVTLRFHVGRAEPGYRKLKALFERVLRRYKPACSVEWIEAPAPVG